MNIPPHRLPNGRFYNPWRRDGRQDGRGSGILRWQLQRLREGIPPTPGPENFPRAKHSIALPTATHDAVRATWAGHSSLLVQIAGVNILTDPVWSRRVSPVQWAGPPRYTEPGVAFKDLPPIHVVLISHDHYDHLDVETVRALHKRHGKDIEWITPLGYAEFFRKLGIAEIVQLDWGDETRVRNGVRLVATPAQHWTRRIGSPVNARLWCSFAVFADEGPRFFYAADSGYCPAFADIAELGPFDLCAIPIGAYEPRWFMRAAHMNPEEAVQTYMDLGGVGVFCGIHWGTFRLADEPPLEPPERVRAEWQRRGLDPRFLWIPRHGETLSVTPLPRRASSF